MGCVPPCRDEAIIAKHNYVVRLAEGCVHPAAVFTHNRVWYHIESIVVQVVFG